MHFKMIVITEDKPELTLEELMAPHEEHYPEDESQESTGFWDWYLVGGRWTGAIKLKALPELTLQGEKRSVGFTGRPGLMTEPNTDPTRCDSTLVKYIDNLSELTTHSVMLKDGKVEEDISAERWAEIVKTLEPTDRLTVVDYHC